MTRLMIELPDELEEKLRARAHEAELEKLLIEGINSGDGREITQDEWDEKRRKLKERHFKSDLR